MPKKPPKKPIDPPHQDASDRNTLREGIELDPGDLQLLRLCCEWPNLNDIELAELCGIDRTTVARRKKKPAFQKALTAYFMPAKDLLESKSTLAKAARKLVSLIEKGEDHIAEKAASKILTSAGALKHQADVQVNLPRPIIVNMGSEKIIAGVPEAIKKLTGKEDGEE